MVWWDDSEKQLWLAELTICFDTPFDECHLIVPHKCGTNEGLMNEERERDQLPYMIFKQCPSLKMALVDLFNYCLAQSEIP